MRLNGSQVQSAAQTQRTTLRQIMLGQILQLPYVELEQRLLSAFEQNPALELSESPDVCPSCNAAVSRWPCPVCGHRQMLRDDVPVRIAPEEYVPGEPRCDEEEFDRFDTVCSGVTLNEHLLDQWGLLNRPATEMALGAELIDMLDERGYLREPLIEIATLHRCSVPEVEHVLRHVQQLDPAGVGARDLQECLWLQAVRHAEDDVTAARAASILQHHFEDLCKQRFPRIQRALHCRESDVTDAVTWIRDRTNPAPGRAFCDRWSRMAPLDAPRVAPDVIISERGDAYFVEIVETGRFALRLDPVFLQMMTEGLDTSGDPMRDSAKRLLAEARILVDAVGQRRQTLYRIMCALVEHQQAFLRYGRAALRPLMQKDLAAQLNLHESTVCRALAGKLMRLPNGETVSPDVFFEQAGQVKEALAALIREEDPAAPFSDGQLATLLAEQGHVIARRTVSKYREMMQIPSVDMRRRRAR